LAIKAAKASTSLIMNTLSSPEVKILDMVAFVEAATSCGADGELSPLFIEAV
jgi:hypothetical protein